MMPNQKKYSSARAKRDGATLILFAVCLPIFLIMIVFAVDIAFMQLTRTELRTAADASARAASRTLSIEQDADAAIAKGLLTATRNTVANQAFQLEEDDIVLGSSVRPGNTGRFNFTPGGTLNSARVTARRTSDSPVGEVNLFFGGLLGTDSFEPVIDSTSTQLDRDIVLVIDRSGSMSFLDNGNNFQPGFVECGPAPAVCRWRGLINATFAFLQELEATPQTELIGLASYANFGTADVPLSDDYTEILNKLNETTDEFCGGGTGIGRGMRSGIEILENSGLDRPFASKVMVVLTDGVHNQPSPNGITPEQVARTEVGEDVTIFTVTFSDFAEQGRMIATANERNGQHFHAPTSAELDDVFRTIARTAANLITD